MYRSQHCPELSVPTTETLDETAWSNIIMNVVIYLEMMERSVRCEQIPTSKRILNAFAENET